MTSMTWLRESAPALVTNRASKIELLLEAGGKGSTRLAATLVNELVHDVCEYIANHPENIDQAHLLCHRAIQARDRMLNHIIRETNEQ